MHFFRRTIPDPLKVALITLIFEDNEKNKFKNYRPIYICHYLFFKNLRKTRVYRRLIKFSILDSKILPKHQYMCTHQHGLEIKLTGRITKAIGEGEHIH